MKDALRIVRVVGVAAVLAFVVAPGAAFAAVAPELDPSMSVAGLALLGGTAAFIIERYRRRRK